MPEKIHFSGEGSAMLFAYNDAILGDLTVVLNHYLHPHEVRVMQAADSEVKLRVDGNPIAVLKPDGGNNTIFEYKDQKGTVWHVYHASKKQFS